jgi:hypothetical protein
MSEKRQIHLVMTSYRSSSRRHELLIATLASLARQTKTPAILWLIDDDGLKHPSLDPALVQLEDDDFQVQIGGVVQLGTRIGQAGAFNLGCAMAMDFARQSCWTERCYLCKVEDDLEFKPRWLETLVNVWESPDFARHHIGMLGGAYGEAGRQEMIGDTMVKLTHHVGAWCMFASMAMWRQYLPIPPRQGIDAQGGTPPSASAADWHLTRRGIDSVAAHGRTCCCVGVVKHTGTEEGDSTWKR